MFEHKSDSLAPRSIFLTRIFVSSLIGLAILAVSLGLGTWGYHVIGGLDWIDALLEASMILTGMGPIHPLPTAAGKLFAVFYCLFSGIIFLTLMAIILAPVYHRFMHRFHLEDEARSD